MSSELKRLQNCVGNKDGPAIRPKQLSSQDLSQNDTLFGLSQHNPTQNALTEAVTLKKYRNTRNYNLNKRGVDNSKTETILNLSNGADIENSPNKTVTTTPESYAAVLTQMSIKSQKRKGQENNNKLNVSQTKNKNKRIVGSGSSEEYSIFHSAPRKTWLHIWNVATGTSEDTILEYIKSKSMQISSVNPSCEKRQSKGDYASFKVGFLTNQVEQWL